jgi:hypothetical protein
MEGKRLGFQQREWTLTLHLATIITLLHFWWNKNGTACGA